MVKKFKMVLVCFSKVGYVVFLSDRILFQVDFLSSTDVIISNMSIEFYTYCFFVEPKLVEFGLIDRIGVDYQNL